MNLSNEPIHVAQILKLIYLEELHLLGVSNHAFRCGCVIAFLVLPDAVAKIIL